MDDAFQATFLVLVRRAASIRDGDRLGPWLYGVAHRVARRIRSKRRRRQQREKGGEAMAAHEPSHEPTPDDLGPALHEELIRLPAKYRSPIVLCDLGGYTHEEAARRLGWPVGTVKGRQSRARDLLRDRLARRGLAPTAGAVAATLAADASAAVPPVLLLSTVRAATSLAAGGATVAAGLASASAVATAKEVSRAMFLIPAKLIATVVTALGLLATGVGTNAIQDDAKPDDRPRARPAPARTSEAATKPDAKPTNTEIASARAEMARGPRRNRQTDIRRYFVPYLDLVSETSKESETPRSIWSRLNSTHPQSGRSRLTRAIWNAWSGSVASSSSITR